jgi:hypothetical protein
VGRARKGRKRGERGPAVGGPQGKKGNRKKEKGRWAGPTRKRVGKRNIFQMHLNLNLKFKFKWKTINKAMQRA